MSEENLDDDIEVQMAEMRHRRRQLQEKASQFSGFDSQLYQQPSKEDADIYDLSIDAKIDSGNNLENDEDIYYEAKAGHLSSYTADSSIFRELEEAGADEDPLEPYRRKKIVERESEYQARRHNRKLSPSRADPFADGGKTPHANSFDNKSRDFAESMKESQLKKQEIELKKEILEKLTNENKAEIKQLEIENQAKQIEKDSSKTPSTRQRRRLGWDVKPEDASKVLEQTTFQNDVKTDTESITITEPVSSEQFFDKPPSTSLFEESRNFQYYDVSETPNRFVDDKIDSTPIRSDMNGSKSARSSRWNQIPGVDATPVASNSTIGATPLVSTSVGMSTRLNPQDSGKTPKRTFGMATPSPSQLSKMAPDEIQALRAELDLGERNKPWTDEELSRMFPFDGYKVIAPPADYNPIRTNIRRVTNAPSPDKEEKVARKAIIDGYTVPSANSRMSRSINIHPDDELPTVKTEDLQYFGKLLNDVDEDALPLEEKKERMVMKLLLKIKNGTPPMRKSGLRQITEKAREFGAGPLFNQILPILMSPSLEDQERHLLVKVIDRILYKLDDLVRPYVHKILVVIEPLLIDEDYFARVEGREIISNLAKAAGLATMISTMRPDIDDSDEYVRNTTARAFSVVASALGIPSLLPFLRAVCKSKKSWQARHTGIKIVHQISVLMGCAVLPHLRALVEIIEHGLIDEQQKVRTMTALAIAGLAEASTPYGIESFDSVLKPLWKGIRQHRGKGLAAFLKAIGFLIPLMDAEYALHYTKEVIVILVREFTTPDEEMRKIVLKVVKQCVSTDGIESSFIRSEILPEFFKRFWSHRMAVDKKSSKQLIETTVEISNKVGCPYMLNRLVDGLKDDSEPYRKMVMEAIDAIVVAHGSTGIDSKLEEQLIDGALYAFQEQFSDDTIVLDGFGTIVNSLGLRTKPYIPQICGIILWRLNNKSPKIRQYAAEMVVRLTPVMKICEEETLISHLSMVLFEYLGEEYPDVLGSILGALKAIVNVIGMNRMNPPIKDLLPRLTPILKNRNEKVEENCIELVGRIADRGSEHVSAREWMRISFDLLDLLSAHRKSIRRAAVNTFGYIAKAIGPQDVIAVLLNNLKVQERQNRVCTTVAIAIVAETCSPFTILPALMNEYRVPEVNVQNGVLKALSFMFEYIGEMSKDYIYSVTPLFEDALTDRDLVHRQIASAAIKHMAVGVFGFGKEDALTHLMNHVWPNILEYSPHVINAVMEAIEGFRLAIGPCRVLQYTLQGLFHPARKVRDIYWKVYNTMYIAAQDALVAFYPSFPNEANNHYQRDELLYML